MTLLDSAKAQTRSRAGRSAPPTAEEFELAVAAALGQVSVTQAAGALKMSAPNAHTWVGMILRRALACGMLIVNPERSKP
jgi:hypothetical protein